MNHSGGTKREKLQAHILAARATTWNPTRPFPNLAAAPGDEEQHKKQCDTLAKTYNSGDSPVVTHLTTDPPVHCLCKAERTGSPILSVLWSYVKDYLRFILYIPIQMLPHSPIVGLHGTIPPPIAAQPRNPF
ncbi:hypothetical protein DPSP01_006956 [Paraphaeosphaeria sporulosa]